MTPVPQLANVSHAGLSERQELVDLVLNTRRIKVVWQSSTLRY